MDKNCSTCAFWVPSNGSANGRCHRFPPTSPHVIVTFNEYWCGEWKARPPEDKKKKHA